MIAIWCLCSVFMIVAAGTGAAYKIPQGSQLPVVRNAPFVYRGPVFIVQETEEPSDPYVAHIVEGGIEMVQPAHLKSFRKSHPLAAVNDSSPEIPDDPEYFAVLVTPETVAQAQISRTTTITIPLPVLLLGISSRIPWVMVLKRQNHFDYFRNLIPIRVPLPQRRRSRSQEVPNAQLFTESRKYDLIYTENDPNVINAVCAAIMEEFFYVNSLLERQTNETTELEPQHQPPSQEVTSSKFTVAKNEAKLSAPQSLEKFLQLPLMVNSSTQTTSESALKKLKILQ